MKGKHDKLTRCLAARTAKGAGIFRRWKNRGGRWVAESHWTAVLDDVKRTSMKANTSWRRASITLKTCLCWNIGSSNLSSQSLNYIFFVFVHSHFSGGWPLPKELASIAYVVMGPLVPRHRVLAPAKMIRIKRLSRSRLGLHRAPWPSTLAIVGVMGLVLVLGSFLSKYLTDWCSRKDPTLAI